MFRNWTFVIFSLFFYAFKKLVFDPKEDVEKSKKWQFFEIFQIRPKVCENEVVCGIAHNLVWNRSQEFAEKF